jgi:hypothetical protein
MSDRLAAELDSFQTIWQGGYFEGDPLDPMTRSGNSHLGWMSTLHATYLACIKPYVDPATVALEIGPGRGAWTKSMLGAREIWAVDALPADHNGFYEYLGHPEHVRYVQATDFALRDLPDGHFSYMFSYGALCHVSFEGITEYAGSTYDKLLPGAHCFWMVADYAKYNRAVASVDRLSPWSRLLPERRRYAPARALLRGLERLVDAPQPVAPDVDDVPRPGRWYDAGIERTCALLESVGYTVLDPDMGVSHRDPVIHFQR